MWVRPDRSSHTAPPAVAGGQIEAATLRGCQVLHAGMSGVGKGLAHGVFLVVCASAQAPPLGASVPQRTPAGMSRSASTAHTASASARSRTNSVRVWWPGSERGHVQQVFVRAQKVQAPAGRGSTCRPGPPIRHHVVGHHAHTQPLQQGFAQKVKVGRTSRSAALHRPGPRSAARPCARCARSGPK